MLQLQGGGAVVLWWAHRVRKIYWRLLKPQTLGSRCLLISEERVLLVQHSYEPLWYLPGGGLKRGERFVDAAVREVREETAVTVRDLRLFGLYHSRSEGKSDHVAVFIAGNCDGEARQGSREIGAVGWFPVRELPADMSPSSRRRIEEYLQGGSRETW
ncbi:MAG: NUDIX domain-containing protein [Chloroflexota bacterium]|nr:NUDIX domain-containing protein [Chloroflexota bacterium]